MSIEQIQSNNKIMHEIIVISEFPHIVNHQIHYVNTAICIIKCKTSNL